MIIAQSHINEILEAAAASFPEECCGLLIGTDDIVTALLPSPNVSTGDKTRTFEIDPAVRFRQIRESGERNLLGFYHSHPNGVPYPSETDKSMVYEPDLIWVIATLNEIRAFRFIEANQDFKEISIQVKL